MNGLYVPFMVNNGQIDERVSLYAKIFGGIVFVTRDVGIIYSLPKVGEKEKSPPGWMLKEELVGGGPAMASLWTRDI